MTDASKVVAITGASGYIGTRLLQRLEEDRSVGKLVAFDTKPLPFPIHNIAVYRRDVAQPIDDMLRRHQVDTLVHLACVNRNAANPRDRLQIPQLNEDALRGALRSGARAGVKHVIYVSSHRVYGAFANNPVPLTESAPAQCYPEAPFGYANLLSERALQEFAENYPAINVTILRASTVLGPSNNDERPAPAFPNRLWGVGSNPPFQFLHEADLARIMLDVIHRGTPGVFNVAGEGVVFFEEIAEITHRRLIHLPAFLVYPAVWLSWKLLLQSVTSRSELDTTRYPIIMSAGKLKQTLGYRFRYTSMEALTAFANFSGM